MSSSLLSYPWCPAYLSPRFPCKKYEISVHSTCHLAQSPRSQEICLTDVVLWLQNIHTDTTLSDNIHLNTCRIPLHTFKLSALARKKHNVQIMWQIKRWSTSQMLSLMHSNEYDYECKGPYRFEKPALFNNDHNFCYSVIVSVMQICGYIILSVNCEMLAHPNQSIKHLQF